MVIEEWRPIPGFEGFYEASVNVVLYDRAAKEARGKL